MRALRGKDDRNGKNGKSKGFSLIELLVVVAVILIIAAIAIPNFIRSRMRANEAAAVANSRDISTAEVVYSTAYGIGYSPDLPSLGGTAAVPNSGSAGLIDSVLGAGTKSGYTYTYTVLGTDPSGNVVAYSLTADPIVPGSSGERHFYTDQSAIIRQNTTAQAGPNDPALQ